MQAIQLKERCQKFGLKKDGTTPILLQRLDEFRAPQLERAGLEKPVPGRKDAEDLSSISMEMMQILRNHELAHLASKFAAAGLRNLQDVTTELNGKMDTLLK